MNITDEKDALATLEAWGKLPALARQREIRTAIEKLELNQMYYEQKDNQQGFSRVEKCIALLEKVLSE